MEPELKRIIIDTLMELDPTEISLFGSYARGEERDDSDIDVLIEYNRAPTLFDIGGVIHKFQLLGIEIDITDKCGVSQEFLNAIEKDRKLIFSNVRRSA